MYSTRVIARFDAPAGELVVLEERGSGTRIYREGGVEQSRVLPGGEAGVEYVRLMAALLAGGNTALLLGCGGGSLAGMLHRRGLAVTVVDSNATSFELARTFFWMPEPIACVVADMGDFIRGDRGRYDGIGIDVGGPAFCYEPVLAPATVAGLRRRLGKAGRIAVNISLDAPDDPVPMRIAERFKAERLDVWMFRDDLRDAAEVNAVILASARTEVPTEIARLAGDQWSFAQLAG